MLELFKQVKLKCTTWLRGLIFTNGLILNRVQRVSPTLITAVLSTTIDNGSLSAPSTRVFHRELAGAERFELP